MTLPKIPFRTVHELHPVYFSMLSKALLIASKKNQGLFEKNEWFYLQLVCALFPEFSASADLWSHLKTERQRCEEFITVVRMAMSDSTPTKEFQRTITTNRYAALLWEHLQAEQVFTGGGQVAYGDAGPAQTKEHVTELLEAFAHFIVGVSFLKGPPCISGPHLGIEARRIVNDVATHGSAELNGKTLKLQPL